MKSKCCRSRPRCAMCPVVLAAGARAVQAPDDGDSLRGAPRRAAPQRELPACVLNALEGLDRRRFVRDN
jgi:ferredoxin